MELVVSVVLLFLGIIVLVAIHVWIVERLFRGEELTGGVYSNEGLTYRFTNANAKISAQDLNRLPCFEFMEEKHREKGKSSVDCAVCLETLKVGDMCRLLPNCRHSFHAQCVDLWLLKKPICPICRTIVKPPRNCIVLHDVRVEVV